MQNLITKEWGHEVAVGVERARIVNGVRMPPEFFILGKGRTEEEARKAMLEDDEALLMGVRHNIPECLQRALERRAGHQKGTVRREPLVREAEEHALIQEDQFVKEQQEAVE